MSGMATQANRRAVEVSLNILQKQHSMQPPVTAAFNQQPVENKHVIRNHTAAESASNTRLKPAVTENVAHKRRHPVRAIQATAPQTADHIVRGVEQPTVTASEHYLSKLLTHIESFKYYPRAAQQREIEGAVTVSFRLLADGMIDNLSVSGAHLLLQKAAQSAVQQALPMLPAPMDMRLPFQVSFVMQYQLPGA